MAKHKPFGYYIPTRNSFHLNRRTQMDKRMGGGDIYFAHRKFNARGVAILIPKSILPKFNYKNGCQDNNGRFILINWEIESNEFTLINIYCPTKNNQASQIEFLEMIKKKLDEHGDKNIILGGDLNTYLNVNLDKKGGKLLNMQHIWKIYVQISL